MNEYFRIWCFYQFIGVKYDLEEVTSTLFYIIDKKEKPYTYALIQIYNQDNISHKICMNLD